MVVLHLGTLKLIENRDATIHRGIAVGDSMRKVLNVYGRPDLTIDGFMGNIVIELT